MCYSSDSQFILKPAAPIVLALLYPGKCDYRNSPTNKLEQKGTLLHYAKLRQNSTAAMKSRPNTMEGTLLAAEAEASQSCYELLATMLRE